jgi:hypothetical protein
MAALSVLTVCTKAKLLTQKNVAVSARRPEQPGRDDHFDQRKAALVPKAGV